MHAEPLIHREVERVQTTQGSIAFASVFVTSLVVFALFAPTSRSMVEIWARSDTFAHGFLVVPAFLYMVWVARSDLGASPAVPSWAGVAAIAGCGSVWLLAELAGSQAPAQFAVIGMVPAALLAVFGWRRLRLLAFPCAFLFFAVPFGEVFVPTLIQWTADFTVFAVRLSGVPVYREGMQFIIPSGQWSVVEACSGIRYLLASAMTGALFAWVMYRSPWRRAIFIVAALLVPLGANWIRAYGIVMLGHLSNNQIATGVDHLVYGWLFFGFVVFLLFAIGARWREDHTAPERMVSSGPTSSSPSRGRWVAAMCCATLAAIAWPVAHAALDAPFGRPGPAAMKLDAVNGWQPATAFAQWRAITQKPSLEKTAYFSKDGAVVGVQLSVYRDQSEGAELVSWGNQLIDESPEATSRVVTRRKVAQVEGHAAPGYRETLLQADRRLVVRDWYWLGDRTTTSDASAKVSLALDRLLRRDDTSAWVLVFTPVREDAAEAQARLNAFQREMGPSIQAALEGLRR